MQDLINANKEDYLSLVDATNDLDSIDREIASHSKAIDTLEKRKNQKNELLRIWAARFFTENVIVNIHSKARTLLRTEYFNKDEYISEFSDSQQIDLGHIHLLLDVCRKIEDVEKTRNANEPKSKKDWLCNLADFITSSKEAENHD